MLNARDARDMLQERAYEYHRSDCGIENALSEPVDADKFYKYASAISNVTTAKSQVSVTFHEPVHRIPNLGTDYQYVVSVSTDESTVRSNSHSGMPREDLVTLQQVAIVLWSIITGRCT